MLLSISAFQGTMPRVDDHRLPLEVATESININSDSQCIQPYYGMNETVPVVGACKAFHVWDNGGVAVPMSWAANTSVCEGVTNGKDSILFTTAGGLRQTDPSNPTRSFPLGVAWPLGIPVATPINDTTGNLNTATSVAYCYTVTDGLGQESKPSSASQYYDVLNTKGGLRLTNIVPPMPYIPLEGTTSSCIINIYRCDSGSDGAADFFFLDSVTYDATTGPFTYDDYNSFLKTIKNTESDIISTEGWDTPPENLLGLSRMAGGILVGFKADTNEVCFSEPLIQYAWPSKYRLKMPQQIREIIGFGDEIVVLMTSSAVVIRGEPGMMSVTEIPGSGGTPCTTGHGAVKTIYGILYPGYDGLYLYSGSVASNITVDALTVAQWREFIPSAFLAEYFDNRYWAFKDMGTDIICFGKDGKVSKMNVMDTGAVRCTHVDYRGFLWIVSGDNAWKWNSSTVARVASWQSGVMSLPYPVNLAAGIVRTKAGTIGMATVKVDAWDGPGNKVTIFDAPVSTNLPFRLPAGRQYGHVQVRVQTQQTVTRLSLATSLGELANG